MRLYDMSRDSFISEVSVPLYKCKTPNCTLILHSQFNPHHSFVAFKAVYDSVRREIWYNILIEFGISLKLARLIKMC